MRGLISLVKVRSNLIKDKVRNLLVEGIGVRNFSSLSELGKILFFGSKGGGNFTVKTFLSLNISKVS